MFDSPYDPANEWDKHCAEEEAILDRRPLCGICGDPIGDEECFRLGTTYYHIDCFDYEHKVLTPDME